MSALSDSHPAPALPWIDYQREHRQRQGLTRHLHPRFAHQSMINLASNDYLGLSTHPQVISAAIEAIEQWGTGSTGSRLVTGDTSLHHQFEEQLARFTEMDSALVFSSGYSANLGVISSLANADTLIISDHDNHASLIDACRLSRASVVISDHNDSDHVKYFLAHRHQPYALVITESVFSTDGALAPLESLYEHVCHYGGILIVDEAHGIGIRGHGGRGFAHEIGITGTANLIMTMTLSKSLASQGGAVLGPSWVRDHLINTARTFIFDTGLAPGCVGAAQGALQVLETHPDLPARVMEYANRLARACGHTQRCSSAIISVILGDAHRALQARDQCAHQGVQVGCFRPPSVPANTSRLRLTACGALSWDDLDYACQVLSQVLERPPSL